MRDPRALVRVFDELVWTIRRAEVKVSTAQAIDALRAAQLVGIADRATLRAALELVLVTDATDLAKFRAAFDGYFGARLRSRSIFDRLEAQGFTAAELETLRDWLQRQATADAGGAERLGALLEGGAALDRLMQLAGIERALSGLASPLQAGFFAQRIVDRVGATESRQRLAALRSLLVDALGDRGEALALALERELDQAVGDLRSRVRAKAAALNDTKLVVRPGLANQPFVGLDPAEIQSVRRAVRTFAARLRGAERVRKRLAARGRMDPHRTLRKALRTGGVPVWPVRRVRRRDRPRLVVVCDVSDSVRGVATFLLEFAYAAQTLFEGTRSFVFVSEIAETTDLFSRESIDRALATAYGGGVVSITDNSNYGRALRNFEEIAGASLDRRTTVVVLGDGRTNYHDASAEVLTRIRDKVRALIWLCPEARSSWASGDSAMARYAKECSAVLEVRCARDLEIAARRILSKR